MGIFSHSREEILMGYGKISRINKQVAAAGAHLHSRRVGQHIQCITVDSSRARAATPRGRGPAEKPPSLRWSVGWPGVLRVEAQGRQGLWSRRSHPRREESGLVGTGPAEAMSLTRPRTKPRAARAAGEQGAAAAQHRVGMGPRVETRR